MNSLSSLATSRADKPLDDTFPGLILGISATFGTFWWILSWFVYVKNTSMGLNLTNTLGAEVVPLMFFWDRMAETAGDQVYLALSLFSTFFGFMLVSVIEFVGWIIYLHGDRSFLVFWASTFGMYGSVVLYIIPVMFAIMQMLIQMGGSLQAAPGAYCVWLSAVGGIYWLINAIIHIEFTPRLKAHAAAWWPIDEAKKPRSGWKCPLNRAEMKTQEEYDSACSAVRNAQGTGDDDDAAAI